MQTVNDPEKPWMRKDNLGNFVNAVLEANNRSWF